MAYTINLTNGTIFATIPDGTVNTSSSMTLIGKNYAGYGQFLDDNFIHLLENSANTTAPSAPLTGQLWWDSTNTLLKVYSGTGGWKGLGGATASATQPSPNIVGDLWYDSTNQQLKVCSVAGNPGTFIVVGPAYSSSQGTSGAIPISINDTSATPHVVTALYANNNLVAIVSGDTTFTPAAPYSTNFPQIYKGTTVWNVGSASGNISNPGNVTLTAAGTTALTVASTGAYVTGLITATGNVLGANVNTGGLISATGNITSVANVSGGNILTGGLISATSSVTSAANITGGNVLSGGLMSATSTITAAANITGGNLITGGLISAASTIISAANVSSAGLVVGAAGASVTGNIQGGNISTPGLISAAGNVTSLYYFGNGSQLTGLSAAVSVSQIALGTSVANVTASGGNIAFTVGGVSNVMVISTTDAIAANVSVNKITHTGTNAIGNIGSASAYFQQAFVDTVNSTAINATSHIGTVVSVTGNITGGNVLGGANVNATTHTGTTVSVSGNITGGNVSATGNVTAASSLNVGAGIFNSAANGVGNIGSSSTYFNTIFAKSTSAQYADVAERFAADEFLAPGTVVELGGTAEITKSTQDLSDSVFGVISTQAAYLMNNGAGGDETHPPVAMTGRVPVQVVGTVNKGDRLVSAGEGYARAALPGEATAFNVIGRALANKTTKDLGLVEAIVTIK